MATSYEIFHSTDYNDLERSEKEENKLAYGWYWWTCFPGCLPDSEPHGPFETEDEATADARGKWSDLPTKGDDE